MKNSASSSGGNCSNSSSQPLQPPQTATTNQPARRPRGRPLGSRNKPKPTSNPVPQSTDATMKIFSFNVAPNRDVIESLLEIVHRDQVSVTVMNASGMINNVQLEPSTEGTPPIMLHGPFRLLSLTGSYFYNNHYILHPGATPPPPPTFGVHLATSQGQIFTGIVGGRVIAGENVVITVSTFQNPEIVRFTPDDREDTNNGPSDFNGGGPFMGFNASYGIRGW